MQRDSLLLEMLEQQKQMNSMLLQTNSHLTEQVQKLTEQVAFLTQKLYGRKSEKSAYLMDGQQMIPGIFNEAEATADLTLPEPEILEKPLKKDTSWLRTQSCVCQSAHRRRSLYD